MKTLRTVSLALLVSTLVFALVSAPVFAHAAPSSAKQSTQASKPFAPLPDETGFASLTAPAPNPDVIRDPASLSLLMDEAGLLTEAEARQVRARLVELSDKHQADIVIITVKSIGSSTPMDFADDFFDYNGYGRGANKDGLLLLISMEERDYWISTKGKAIYAFTDAGIEFIGKKLRSDGLSDGYYASAFTSFADWSDKFFVKAASGTPYDVGRLPKTFQDLIGWVFGGLFGGLFTGGLATGGMQRKLVSVRKREQALDYIVPGSFLLNASHDAFLGSNVVSVPRAVAAAASSSGGGSSGGSSTHTSSSGSTHGGGGGKF